VKTRIHRDVATARRPGRPIPAAMGTAGWAQAEADRARIRTALHAPPDWRVPATTGVPASTTWHGAARALIQPKLTIGEVNDPLEREADAIAEKVVRMPDPALALPPAPVRLSGQPASATHAADPTDGEASPILREVLRSPGQPLDAAARAYFEPRFGQDFSNVRLHTHGRAAAAAADIQARAYTWQNDIGFAAGEFSPSSLEGRRLIAHELAHVAQNQRESSAGPVRRDPPPASLQQEPRIVSEVWMVAGRPVVVVEVGGKRKAFYQRSTSKLKGRTEGHVGAQQGDWAPFDGFSVRRGSKGQVTDGYFEKNDYFRGIAPNDPRYSYGNAENLRTAEWLAGKTLPEAKPAEWRFVQAQLQALNVPVKAYLPEQASLAPVKPEARHVQGEIDVDPRGAPSGGGTAAKETVVVTEEVAQGVAQGATRTSRLRTAGRFFAGETSGLILQVVLMFLFPPAVHYHNEKAQELSRAKLDPAVQDDLPKHETVFDKLQADDPSKSIYANVTARLDYKVDASPSEDLELYLNDVTFVEMKITNEYIVLSDPELHQTASRNVTKEVTYSFALYEPEGATDPLKHYQLEISPTMPGPDSLSLKGEHSRAGEPSIIQIKGRPQLALAQLWNNRWYFMRWISPQLRETALRVASDQWKAAGVGFDPSIGDVRWSKEQQLPSLDADDINKVPSS
jgi:hypothetical protein